LLPVHLSLLPGLGDQPGTPVEGQVALFLQLTEIITLLLGQIIVYCDAISS
jgi:hypothetical protein